MKFIKIIKAEEKSPVSKIRQDREGNNIIDLWFNVQIIFSSEQRAIYFRKNLIRDSRLEIYYSDSRTKLVLPSYYTDSESDGWYMNDKYPSYQTIFRFDASVHDYAKPSKDISQNYFKLISFEKEELIKVLKSYDKNADIKVEVIPPQLKSYDYKDEDFMQMQDRVDSLFEGLSTSEIRNYDFVIVGKDKAEAESIKNYYIQNSRYNITKWQYRKKDDLTDYDKKEGDMTYIKTVSQELDNGIYCLTVRARKYFKDWQGNQETLIPVYDAKASQLSGKVVIAKKNNFIRVLKSGEPRLEILVDIEKEKWEDALEQAKPIIEYLSPKTFYNSDATIRLGGTQSQIKKAEEELKKLGFRILSEKVIDDGKDWNYILD